MAAPWSMKLRFLLVSICILAFTNCFHVLHFINGNSDGSVEVLWRFTISRQFEELSKQNQPGEGGEKKETLAQKIEKSKTELNGELAKHVDNFIIKGIETEHDMGLSISFKVKDYAAFPFGNLKDEEFPLLPQWDKKSKQITFTFKPNETTKTTTRAQSELPLVLVQTEMNEESPEEGTDSMNQMAEGLTKAILSSARYQIFLGGSFVPVKAEVRGKTKAAKSTLEIVPLGSNYLIDVPYVSFSDLDPQGYDVIVTLK